MHRLSPALTLLAATVAACSPTPSVPPSGLPTLPLPTATSGSQSVAPSSTSAAFTFADGEHRVREDIEPGTYRAIPPDLSGDGFCYWERVSGFGGTDAETIANSAGVGPRVVTIGTGDAGFNSDDCGTWTSDVSAIPGPYGDGVWIVGTDLEPGRYSSEGGAACVWQRLSGFGGTADESLTVGLTGTVEILATDRGFSSSNCGIWTREGD